MQRGEIYAAIAEERRNIADLLDSLDDTQSATPSLCGGWDVKTVVAHLVSVLENGTRTVTLLSWRHRSMEKAMDQLARARAQSSSKDIADALRSVADHTYFRFPPQAPGLLAEVLCHSGDIRIPLGLPFEPDATRAAIALGFLTGPVPTGMVPLRRLRGIGWRATDIDRTWGDGPEIRGRAADLLMATVGRVSVLNGLDGPGLPLLRKRMSG
jgi:uncharacterized protein (TIGR03083 family)